jgi:hypothetical protein
MNSSAMSHSAAAISDMIDPRLKTYNGLQSGKIMSELTPTERNTMLRIADKNIQESDQERMQTDAKNYPSAGGRRRRRLTKRSKKSKRVTRVKRRRSSMRYFRF